MITVRFSCEFHDKIFTELFCFDLIDTICLMQRKASFVTLLILLMVFLTLKQLQVMYYHSCVSQPGITRTELTGESCNCHNNDVDVDEDNDGDFDGDDDNDGDDNDKDDLNGGDDESGLILTTGKFYWKGSTQRNYIQTRASANTLLPCADQFSSHSVSRL